MNVEALERWHAVLYNSSNLLCSEFSSDGLGSRLHPPEVAPWNVDGYSEQNVTAWCFLGEGHQPKHIFLLGKEKKKKGKKENELQVCRIRNFSSYFFNLEGK